MLNADEYLLAIEESRCGDLDSFEKLILFYYPQLHRYVACKIGDFAEVDDVLQEILLVSWLNINKLRNVNAFKAWLMRIANNCCNKWYKSKTTFDEPTENDTLNSLIDRGHFMSGESVDNEQLLFALEKLPEYQRQAITDFYFKDLKISEIAFVHNIPAGTIKRRLHDGRLSLKKRLEELDDE